MKKLVKTDSFQETTGNFVGKYLIPQFFWELWFRIRTISLIVVRTMVMNPENHPDNQHGFGAISNTHPNTGLEPDKKIII